jgi:hypothetical protein
MISTFPTENLSLRHLEFIAASSWRLRRLFMTPVIGRSVIRPVKSYTRAGGSFKQAHLASGGRYLFTATQSKLLQLWDIGLVCDNTEPRWQLVASVQLRHDALVSFRVIPGRDGSRLYVVMNDCNV